MTDHLPLPEYPDGSPIVIPANGKYYAVVGPYEAAEDCPLRAITEALRHARPVQIKGGDDD